MLLDATNYEVGATGGDFRNEAHVKAVAEVSGRNFLGARKLLQEIEPVVCEGKAPEVARVKAALAAAGVSVEYCHRSLMPTFLIRKKIMITRRNLLHTSLSATALLAAPSLFAASPKRKFKLQLAPHFGQFAAHAGESLVDQLKFMADEGFTALEDNGMMQRSTAEQETIARTLAQLGMSMGVFVVAVGGNENRLFTTGEKDNPQKFAKACEDAVAVAKRVNAKWMTVVPGVFTRKLPIGIQTANAIDVLRAGAEVFERENLVMVLEPLADSPDLFLRTADQAYELCRAIDSPACKILFDMYHLQQNQGSITASIDQTWNEIAYFQMGDVPGRLWPGTGEMNYGNLFKHILQKMRESGRDFIFGMEHGPWKPNKASERACIESYTALDAAL